MKGGVKTIGLHFDAKYLRVGADEGVPPSVPQKGKGREEEGRKGEGKQHPPSVPQKWRETQPIILGWWYHLGLFAKSPSRGKGGLFRSLANRPIRLGDESIRI